MESVEILYEPFDPTLGLEGILYKKKVKLSILNRYMQTLGLLVKILAK